MKKIIVLAALLITGAVSAQTGNSLKPFKALESEIDAQIHLIKSDTYRIEFSGNTALADKVLYEVGAENSIKRITDSGVVFKTNNLNLSAVDPGINFEDLVINIYAPDFKVVSLSNGGKITMDDDFSERESFVLAIDNDALADFSNIDFKSLVVSSDNGSKVLYKSVKSMVSSMDGGSRVIINSKD